MKKKQRVVGIIKGLAFPIGYYLFMSIGQTILTVLLSIMISVRSVLASMTLSGFEFNLDMAIDRANQDTLITSMKYASFFSALTTIAALVILWLVFNRKGKHFTEYFGFKRAPFKAILAAVLLGLSVHFMVNTIVTVTDPWITQLTEAAFRLIESILPSFGQWLRAYYQSILEMMEAVGEDVGMFTVAAVCGAPLIEELVFRAGPLRKFQDRMPVWAALLITSALFAMAHSTPVQMAYTFVVGLMLGLLYIRSDSIYPAILAHFCFNAANLIPMVIEGVLGGPHQTLTMAEWLTDAYNAYTVITFILAIPMLAVGLILLFTLRPKTPTQVTSEADARQQIQDTTKEQAI